MLFLLKNLAIIQVHVSRLTQAVVAMRRIYFYPLALVLSLVLAAVSMTSAWAYPSLPLDFKPEDFYSIIGLLVPGMIILFVRSQFVPGRLNTPHPILSYLAVSSVYYALVLLVINPVPYFQGPDQGNPWVWLLLVFLFPGISGLLLGLNIQGDWTRRFIRGLGLNPVHVIPSAWDWKFGNMEEQWVLVTLKDGTQVAGFCGENSFASSDPAERDIYIQWMYEIDEDGNWFFEEEKGILISAGEIETVKFWPYEPVETKNESK